MNTPVRGFVMYPVEPREDDRVLRRDVPLTPVTMYTGGPGATTPVMATRNNFGQALAEPDSTRARSVSISYARPVPQVRRITQSPKR
jgi:hypothetical protein